MYRYINHVLLHRLCVNTSIMYHYINHVSLPFSVHERVPLTSAS